MPLDPVAQSVLAAMERTPHPPWTRITPAELRALRIASAGLLPKGPAADVEDRTLPAEAGGLQVRRFRPRNSEARVLPLVVHFHGGGFVSGNLDQSDGECRRIANDADCTVVSVEYPLAPEHKFPEPALACYRALAWLSEHARELEADPERVAVAGDSAGGNLAAVCALLARERGGPKLAAQILFYPVCDLSNFDTLTYRENAEGYFLTREGMRWFAAHYLRSTEDALDPLASPLVAADLARLPPALIVTAEFDPLRDEAEAYAQKLRAHGTRAELVRYDGMIHGFVTMAAYFESGMRALHDAATFLRREFS